MERETGSDQEEHAPEEHDNSEEYDNSNENNLLNQIKDNTKQIQQLSQIIQQIDFRSLPGEYHNLLKSKILKLPSHPHPSPPKNCESQIQKRNIST